MEWKLADAKNRFSELVNKVMSEGPQWVSRRKDKVVVISQDEYRKLTGEKPDFVKFLVSGERKLDGDEFERDQSLARDVTL